MRLVQSFPHRVREIENVWIRMPDGCRLAARVWLPECAERGPVPAILEAIPYRKRDGTRERDETMHRWFAGHGYAAVRLDVRGTGISDGVLLDEYTEQEQADGVETIQWIASQPWCNGTVGMIGKSWGGIAALQIAARRPHGLRAVITVCSTDDRYATDAHWMGGCLLNENLTWGSMLLTIAALPPDPEARGPEWRDIWRTRLDNLRLFPEIWMRHPDRDAYWRRGSICEDFARIECPVYAVSGWADAYTDTVPRLLAGLRGPRKGLVGPWAHLYPHEGVPGPAIGFLQEAKRWWDHWLLGIPTGIADEAQYRVWMPEGPPDAQGNVPGRWVAEEAWPSPSIEARRLVLGASRRAGAALDPDTGARGTLVTSATGGFESVVLVHSSPQSAGLDAGPWCRFGIVSDRAPDQRDDDARSLVFDSEPLEDRLEILGTPVATLRLVVNRSDAFVAARLCDVAPDGASHRVSYGLLHLAHRSGPEHPRRVVSGEEMEVRVVLRHAAHAFRPGHRLRLAISTNYWPITWPSPEPVTLSLRAGSSGLELPVRPPRTEDAALQAFEPAEGAASAATENVVTVGSRRRIERDASTGEVVCTTWIDCDADRKLAIQRFPAIDLEVGHGIVESYRVREGDPLSARAEVVHQVLERRDGWSVRVDTRARLEVTHVAFRLAARIEAHEGEERVFEKEWRAEIPRDRFTAEERP